MYEKYNWYKNLMSDYDLDRNTEIKYIEIETDYHETFTFIFIKDEVKESFFVYKIKAKDLINKLNNLKIVHTDLRTVAPSLYNIIGK